MTLTKLTGVVLAVLLVATGVTAALPGNAPADSHAGEAGDHPAEQADSAPDEHAEDGLNRSDDARAADEAAPVSGDGPPIDVPRGEPARDAGNGTNASEQGPPAEMPTPVPDFVSEIHDLIRHDKIGALEEPLGDLISELTPGEETVGNTTQREMPNPALAGVGPA